jgi:hypothetical protein
MNQQENPVGTMLMPIFGLATIIVVVAAALTALLGRLIVPEEH